MSRKTIIFWGPLARQKGPIGGGEAGNRRTVTHLAEHGFNIIEVPKPYPPDTIFRPIVFALRLLSAVSKFIVKCSKNRNDGIAHISGYYSHLIYFELALLAGSKLFNLPCVYEIRGGAMLAAYKSRSFIYRIAFETMLRHADALLIQGEEYRNFIEQKTDIKPVYYPNYVNEHLLNKKRVDDEPHTIRLIYFGRITEDKGVMTTLDVCKELHMRGFDVHLALIGTGAAPFLNKIRIYIAKQGLEHMVTTYPPLSQPEIVEHLSQSHFFVFPTYNPMEGHSNALTEAMALGVVPVCSDAGFNSSVVDVCGIVLPNKADAADYADALIGIWNRGSWKALSEKCRMRISNHFNSSLIIGRLIETYETL